MIDFSQIFGGGGGGIGGSGVTGSDLGGLASAGFSIAGGFLAAEGAEQAGKARSDAYLANAAVQGQNAGLARYTAGRNQLFQDYLTSRIKGQQVANYGAANVGPGGSPSDIMADTEAAARFDAFNRFYAGEQEAKQASTAADADVRAAKAAREAADTASTSDILGGIGSAVKVAASLFAL